ncbi:MAG: hypothetical protein P1V51_00540 [Deltaproteobacteria bacterium]|nr:hypothetical protein [Deltaproteobacteria bacterium]
MIRHAIGFFCLFLVACGNGVAEGPDGGTPDASLDAGLDGGGMDAGSDGGADGGFDGGGADGGGADGGAEPFFDLDAIRDASTAGCTFENERRAVKDLVALVVWDVSYTSWESIDGVLQPITIRGFAARPQAATGAIPGVVQAHGLGGYAEVDNATGPAALLGTFVLAFTGPGGGTVPENTSEGLGPSARRGRRLFDTIPDPRGSWIWSHTVAGLRGLTCLATRPEVDTTRLGFTGYSAGGVATLIASGVDDRIVAGVPLSASLRWELAVASPNAWQHDLLESGGLDTSSPEWLALVEALDAEALLSGTTAAIWMVNGSSDEFFPLPAHFATYDAFDHASRRSTLIGNGDHGCLVALGVPGIDAPSEIQARADLRARGAQRAWFHHHFGTDAAYACLPETPTFTLTPLGAVTQVDARVDTTCAGLQAEAAEVWWSGDGGLTFLRVGLDDQGGGAFAKLAAFPTDAGTVAFVDVTYRTDDFFSPERFSVSTRPVLPAGFVPRVFDTTCAVP